MSLNKTIDTETELLNIVYFLKKTWVLPNFTEDALISFIRTPFEAGLKGGENWCGNTKLSLKIYDILEERDLYLDKEHDSFQLFDGYYQMISSISDGLRKLEKNGIENWDYSRFCSQYISQAIKIVGKQKIHPKPYGQLKDFSYEKIEEDFEDFDTLGYWDKDSNGQSQEDKENSIFKGIYFENSPFVPRITLHNILQSDVNQGRDPLHELISAIITYGLNIAEFNNTVGAIDVIKSIKLPDSFSYDLPELPNHKFLQACYYAGNRTFKKLNSEIKEDICKHKKHMKSLTQEEITAIKEENNKSFNNMINSIMNNTEKEKTVKNNLTLSEVYKIIDIKNF